MKILFVTLNSQFVHSALAVWYLQAAMRRGCPGMDVAVIEGTVNEGMDGVFARIAAEKPDIIGFSCYIWNREKLLGLARRAKGALGCRVVFGGPEAGFDAEDILRDNPFIDYVISGEGEGPWPLLARAVEGGAPVCDIPGLCYRHGDKIIAKPPYYAPEEPPSPYCAEYFAALSSRIAYIEASRGCPFRCAFCLSGGEGGVCNFGMDRVREDILALCRGGARLIKFIDRSFNASDRRAVEIIRFITGEYGRAIPPGTRFHFELEGELITPAQLAAFAAAPRGVFQAEVGLQSLNPDTLAAINRHAHIERACGNIRALIALGGVHVHIDLIAGLPHEGMASLRRSFDGAYALHADMLQFGFLKLLHGADMRMQPGRFPLSFDAAPPYQVLSTPWLDEGDMQALHAMEKALSLYYNSGRFRRGMEYLLSLCPSPFDVYMRLGALVQAESPKGDDAFALLLRFAGDIPGADIAVLRDALMLDRLCRDSSGHMPVCLRREDKRLAREKLLLDAEPSTRRPANTRRAAALIYTHKLIAWADYLPGARDAVSGEYAMHFKPYDG